MKEKEDKRKKKDFPNQETKYQQVVEEMKQLIPFLIDEMKLCPTEDLIFNLVEVVDFYSLKRNFKFKSKPYLSIDSSIINFKEKFISNLSIFDSFITLPGPNSNLIPIESMNNKGNLFKSPKVFDVNGDEGLLNGNNKEIFLFLYDNINELDLFLQKNNNSEITCFCLGINVNFFETKKWLKNTGYLNNNFYFYFKHKQNKENDTNIKLYNLPRIVHIDSENIIKMDKNIKNLQDFESVRDLINKDKETEGKKESNFIFLENDNKRKIIKAINIYLKTAGLIDVNFYVVNKISIGKSGIKKIRCYPAFYGETNKIGKYMVDNLVDNLNKQELFKDIQNKVVCNHEE